MARGFDLRNDRDIPRLCIRYDIADLVLSIKSLVRRLVADIWLKVTSDDRLRPFRADLG